MMRRRAFLMTGIAAASACAPPGVGPPSRPEPPRPPKPPQAVQALEQPALVHRAQVGHFALHGGMWMNLHHLLYALAAEGDQAIAQVSRLRPELEALAPEERGAWDDAVELYRGELTQKDLLFDPTLLAIKATLAAQEGEEAPALGAELASVEEALRRVAPSYRTRLWPQHLARSQSWIRAVQPLVEEHGAAMMPRLAQLLHATWPSEPMRVDLCMTAKWSGAYTSLGPLHIVMATDDRRNQGSHALEILFHEGSHGVIRPVRDALTAECDAQGVEEPRQLWHAILFYTCGAVVAERIPGHVPYAEREGLWRKVWPAYRRALEGAWRPYLAGERSFEQALTALVASFDEPAG